MKINNLEINLVGHSAIVMKGEKIIYIDPFEINDVSESNKADILLISHPHYDHCSITDIEKIIKPETVIITVADCQSKISRFSDKIKDIKLVEPGSKLDVEGIKIEVVPAYNIDKPNHPKANKWVGFVVTSDNQRIYYAGDTDLIPEMNVIECEVALLPVGGTYTMDWEEAASATKILIPDIAIPIHYGKIVGSVEDAEKFKKACECDIEIL